jgi:hypothetical protein
MGLPPHPLNATGADWSRKRSDGSPEGFVALAQRATAHKAA